MCLPLACLQKHHSPPFLTEKWGKALDTNPDYLSLISQTHLVEVEKTLESYPLTVTCLCKCVHCTLRLISLFKILVYVCEFWIL